MRENNEKKLNWEEPKLVDLLINETQAGYCDGRTPDGFFHETQDGQHNHYSV